MQVTIQSPVKKSSWIVPPSHGKKVATFEQQTPSTSCNVWNSVWQCKYSKQPWLLKYLISSVFFLSLLAISLMSPYLFFFLIPFSHFSYDLMKAWMTLLSIYIGSVSVRNQALAKCTQILKILGKEDICKKRWGEEIFSNIEN